MAPRRRAALRRASAVAVATACAVTSVRTASADPPAAAPARSTTKSVALLAGYGLPIDTFKGDMSPYRFGFGVRAGVTLPYGGYIGGTFVKHLGTSRRGTREGDERGYLAYAHDTYLGPEIGWERSSARVVVRTYVGAGALIRVGRTVVGASSRRDEDVFLFLAPGAIGAVRWDGLFVGIDARFNMIPAQPSKDWAPSAMFVVGLELDGAR